MTGDYGAGIAASSTDPNVSYYNPGAMTNFTGQTGGISTLFRSTSARFKGNVMVSSIPSSNFKTNSQGGRLTFTPTLTYVAPVSKRWAFGFSLVSPLNAKNYYSNKQATRYIVTQNQLYTTDFDPALAFQLIPELSIGLGFDAIHGNLIYKNITTVMSLANDSTSRNKLSGWAHGFNAGIFWQASKTTKVGLSYHSEATLHLTGTSKFIGRGVLAPSRTRARAHISIPAETVLSAQQMLDKQWTLLGTITFTQWSQLNNTLLRRTATPTGTIAVTYIRRLRNIWQLILGAHYKWNNKVLVMGALGYTPSLLSNSNRTLVVPDGQQYSASVGLHYNWNKSFAIILGYTHLFVGNTKINTTQTFATNNVTSTGRMNTSADVIGLQVNWKMT